MINNIVLKAIFLLSLAYLLTSCFSYDPSADKGPDQALIRMHVPPGYYNDDAYLVITDMDANGLLPPQSHRSTGL
ncbi:hypothetical protein [Chryseolinea sp. H1M3-3]|uniref:hypothetical protein n=1 Tax=Chryseolinea sp. H1M3-3 TaxID=3034144 RepID=UPI0023ECCA17|nr:hypothetical protein [Chryseolinea sp. H1M3-3]